jgi:hypothetical protein
MAEAVAPGLEVRFSGRFLMVRFVLWTLLAASAVTLVVYPGWADDTPVVRFLPDVVLQALAVLSFTYPARVLWRLADVAIHRLPALAFSEREVVVRADLLLRRRSYAWTSGDTIAEHIDRRVIRLGHGDAWISVPRYSLHGEDLAKVLRSGGGAGPGVGPGDPGE